MPFNIPTGYSKLKTFINGGSLVPNDLNTSLDDVGNEVYSHKVDIAAIKETGFVTASRIAMSAVTTAKLADGAVTVAKAAPALLNTLLNLVVVSGRPVLNFGYYNPATGFDSTAGKSQHITDYISHGLGVNPSLVLAMSYPILIQEDSGVRGHPVMISVYDTDAGAFRLLREVNGTTNNGAALFWLAIGRA